MLFAFDLDKTLVTNDFTLPPDTAAAIAEVRRSGHHVSVLTGRPHGAAKPFLQQLDVKNYYSVNHGALVFGLDGTVMRQHRIPAATVRDLLTAYEHAEEVSFACIVDDVLYVRDPDHDRWSWAHSESRTVERLALADSRDTDKIVFLAAGSENGERTSLEREIRSRMPDAITYLWEDGFLEVTSPGSDKGGALELIASTLGVAREDTIAFGDGLNDVTMLAWAGHAVAVGPHVHADALAQADEHVPSPEEGGVAAWLREHYL